MHDRIVESGNRMRNIFRHGPFAQQPDEQLPNLF
jgi:hypothetical protein